MESGIMKVFWRHSSSCPPSPVGIPGIYLPSSLLSSSLFTMENVNNLLSLHMNTALLSLCVNMYIYVRAVPSDTGAQLIIQITMREIDRESGL